MWLITSCDVPWCEIKETDPVAAQSKARVCGHSFAGNASSNHAGGMDVACECCACCQVEVPATGRSLVQRSPTECGVSEV
jgi:hypothetical protein